MVDDDRWQPYILDYFGKNLKQHIAFKVVVKKRKTDAKRKKNTEDLKTLIKSEMSYFYFQHEQT